MARGNKVCSSSSLTTQHTECNSREAESAVADVGVNAEVAHLPHLLEQEKTTAGASTSKRRTCITPACLATTGLKKLCQTKNGIPSLNL